MTHPALAPSRVAVVTGAASGIGFAAAKHFAALQMKVCIADRDGERLRAAAEALAAIAPGGAADVLAVPTDVGDRASVRQLHATVRARFGAAHVLMNNAGVQPGSGMFGPEANWAEVLQVNLWGVIHGTHVFAPEMIAHGEPGLIINTGSKQGITTPPGDPAYNVSKAGVRAFTEALQHELRNTEGHGGKGPLRCGAAYPAPSLAWPREQRWRSKRPQSKQHRGASMHLVYEKA
jgi:NAD(P)-dependent dehydrogenase (short-subunit alcohol dehydrogenase family)